MTVSTTRQSNRPATLAPFITRPGRSNLRNTFQIAAHLEVPAGWSVTDTFDSAANTVLDWLVSKFPQALPTTARDLESFEVDHHGHQQMIGVSIPEDGLWCVRLVQPDAPFGDRPAVAGRTWTTDLALHRSNDQIRFGARILCASATYAEEPITLTRPRIVIDLARKFGLREIRPLDGRPWILQSENDLESLRALLTDPTRTMPVIALTHPSGRHVPGQVAEYLLNHEYLARKTQGLAHVVCIPTQVAYAWTEMVGKVWSVFLGAVRTYLPGLDFENDSPFSHPRKLAEDIVFWRHNDLNGEKAFASFLTDRMFEQAATKYVDWGGCLFYTDARSRRAALAREHLRRQLLESQTQVNEATVLRDQLRAIEEVYKEEHESLEAQVKQMEEERDVALQLGETAEAARERVLRENQSLQIQNDTLRRALRVKGHDANAAIPIPQTYDDMPDWVEEHLTGRLMLHPRALHGIKKAAYEDVTCVYNALLLLADSYRTMRRGDANAKVAWEAGLGELGMKCDRSISRERAGERGDTYFLRYPLGSNQREFLEWHLTKGSTKDDRMCLRIYFIWDSDSSQVVVGWLPSHLDTRAT